MAGFGIVPVSNFPTPAPQDFPKYIQWQVNGVNLGGPDATTVNFVGFTVTRGGSGVDDDTITVTLP